MRIARALVFLAALLAAVPAFAQATLLQGGPWVPGHMPQYAGPAGMGSQPIVIDGGGAGGGGSGVTLGEIGITSRDPLNAYPSANSGTGPFGTHGCLYDAPTTNGSGYHFLCFDPNALGGGLIAYGAGGVAAQLPLQCNINGVLTNCFNGSPPPPPTPAPIVAKVPDTHQGFFAVTWTGSGTITLAAFGGQGIPSFTASDIGKDIVCTGFGGLENGAYAGVIAGVSSGSVVTLVPTPTLTMTAYAQKCAYGTDQSVNLQTTFTAGQAAGVGSYVPGGIYLVNTPLVCLPPPNYNNLNASAPLCALDPGAYLLYAGTSPATNFISYGSLDPSFSGHLAGSEITGGTIDGNFNVMNDVYVPFFANIARRAQMTKNALQHHVQYGDVGAPSASSAAVELVNFGARDINYITVTNVTNGPPAVVTTAHAHGFTTGRVVTFTGAVGQAALSTQYFQITVTGPTTFTLNNATLSGTFTSALVSQTMPSMAIEQPVNAVTQANPAVITAPVGTVPLSASGTQFFIADLGMTNAAGTDNCIDGNYTVTYLTTTTFSIPVDTTTCSSFAGGGRIIPAPNFDTAESFIYNANATDSQYWGDQFYGVRIGVSNNLAGPAGFDAKIQYHVYNLIENGEMLAGYYGSGDNNFLGLQVDCPARFAIWLSHAHAGKGSSSFGSEMNCAGFGVLQNNEASFVRLEDGATFNQIGGSIKGQGGALVLQQVSSPHAPLSQFGRIPGYSSDKVAYTNLTYPQPDGNADGNFVVFSSTTSSSIEAVSTETGGIGLLEAYDTNAGHYGFSITSSNLGGSMNLIDNAGAFVLTAIFATPSLMTLEEPIQFASMPTSAGGGGLYICIDTSGLSYKKSSCP